jgi:hypothetical protein
MPRSPGDLVRFGEDHGQHVVELEHASGAVARRPAGN